MIISVESFQEVVPGALLFLRLQHHGDLPESDGRLKRLLHQGLHVRPSCGCTAGAGGCGAVMGVATRSHQRPGEGCGHAGGRPFSF